MAKKQAYVVLVGLQPGVYANWLDVTQNVVGVPEAQYKGFTYFEEAAEYYERAHKKGATRAVKKPPPPPKDDEQSKAESKKHRRRRSSSGPERQPPRDRRRQDSSPAGSVQALNTPTSRGRSAGRAARDAQIAAALAEARRSRIGPSASMPSVISTERSKSKHTTLARSATEPAYHPQPQPQDTQTASTPRRPARRTRKSEATSPETERELQLAQQLRTPETNSKSTPSGPSSDIPTDKTQRRNRFTNSPGLCTPRYAQSLSYASSSPSLSLRSSDMRSHLSSPSSFGTRYFPEDWLARLERRRESGYRGGRGEDQGSVFTVSEYATAPNTPEMGSVELATVPNTPEVKSIELEDVDDIENMRDVAGASPSWSARSRVGVSEPSSSPTNAKARPKTQSSAMPPPATPTVTEVISSPNATSTPRRTSATPNTVNDRISPSTASVPPPSTLPEPKNNPATRVTRSLSEAEVQTESPPPVRRRKNLEAAVQAAPPSPSKRQHVENEVQTSPVASPMRTSTAVGDVPVRPPLGGAPCRCEHPEYACIHCGQRPRAERRSAHRAAVDVDRWRSSLAPSTPPGTVSPALSGLSPALPGLSSASASPPPSATPASMTGSAVRSSVSTRSSSSRSHVGGHTPLMGPSESRSYLRSPTGTARVQASLGMMSFSEAAQGAAVVHDVSFDPRSPIQRGTSVPAGTSGSAVRPSPAMAPVPVPVPVPMGSLGLLFNPS